MASPKNGCGLSMCFLEVFIVFLQDYRNTGQSQRFSQAQ